MSVWCVVHTLPHQEARAEANLLRQNYRAWLPVMTRSRRHARRIDTVCAPVFPGYLFVYLDLEREAWGKINNTFGVRRILAQGERPQALPDDFVVALRQTIGEDLACTLTPPDLEPGTQIRVVSGPFVDCVAKITSVASGDRVKILLDALGGEVMITMPRQAVIRAA